MIKYAPHAAGLVAVMVAGNWAYGTYTHYVHGREAQGEWAAAQVAYQDSLNRAIEARAAADAAANRAYDEAVAKATRARAQTETAIQKRYPDVPFVDGAPKVADVL